MFGRDRLCAVVASATAAGMASQLQRALRRTRTAELRLDWLRSDGERAKLLAWLSRRRARGTLIATCRRRAAGGKYEGSIQAQLEILAWAVRDGCAWCDVEIETARRLPAESLGGVLRPARVLLSVHDFEKTPGSFAGIRGMMRLARKGADAIKVATQTKNLAEGLRVLSLARGTHNVVAVPMGEASLPLRVLALREGSALAYAPVEQATAPGQVSLEDMQEVYRSGKLDRRTEIYGVIGDPIAQSLSPVLHNTGYQARHINAVYLPFLVRELKDFLRAIDPLGIAGFSITLPHKHAILRHLSSCEPLAAKIGAVNTVVVSGDGKLHGYNTDYAAIIRSLASRVQLHGCRVLLFGAGGVARTAAFALAQNGSSVFICARRREETRALARAVGGETVPRRRLRSEFFDVIINATPVGMFPNAQVSPLEPGELNCRVVMDLIYRPMKTRLLQIAEKRGLETISGVEMFLAQGVAQWEIWSGRRAPEAAMRRAVLKVLRKEERAGVRSGERE